MNTKFGIGIVVVLVLLGLAYVLTTGNKDEVGSEYAEERVAADSIVGTWQSTDDESSVRVIYENGGFADVYQGEELSSGSWYVFDGANAPEDFPYPAVENVEYLALVDAEGTLFFSIAERTEQSLTLIYLDRGGALSYSRVTE